MALSSKNQIDSKGMKGIVLALENLKQIETLKLKISKNGIREYTPDYVGKAIASLPNLRHLEIGMNFDQILDKGLSKFANNLKKCQQLESLTLDFLACELNEAGLIVLFEAIKSLSNLEALSIDLNENNLGPKGARLLGSSMHFWPSLRNLTLNLAENGLGSDGPIQIAHGLSKLKRLEHLKLNFEYFLPFE
jgi:Ran GTPase-activating protein (RanGAP) involved in mRNA processing and transport